MVWLSRFRDLYLVLSSVCLGLELLNHMVNLCLMHRGNDKPPPPAVLAFYVQACRVWGFQRCCIFINICYFHIVLTDAILVHKERHFIGVSHCTFRKTNSIENIFMYFLKSSVSLERYLPVPSLHGFHSYTGHRCG